MLARLKQFSGLFMANETCPEFERKAITIVDAVAATGELSPPRCHAEIVVLLCAALLLARSGGGVCNHIGISKLCCVVCYAFITLFCQLHHIKFTTSGTHGKMYEWSGLPATIIVDNTSSGGGGTDGGGEATFSMAQAMGYFDPVLKRRIFSGVRDAVAAEFARRCKAMYRPNPNPSVAESDSDTSIDGARPSAYSRVEDSRDALALITIMNASKREE
jgi:hypothetical protein